MRWVGFVIAVFTLCLRFAAAEPAPTTAAYEPRVLVLPFENIGTGPSDEASAAVARAMHRSLVVDLSRVRNLRAVDATEVAPDRDAAIAAGKSGDADSVVWGTVQYVEGRVRVDGEVLDVHTADAKGRFKVTGTLRELFELQDLVAEQVRRHVSQPAPAERGDQVEGVDNAEPAEVPEGKPLRVAGRGREPAWSRRPSVLRDDITLRYNYADEPYWYSPYWRWPYHYYSRGYYGYYHYPYRPLRYRLADDFYTYRGLPDRPAYYEFHGPVPLRWHRRY